MSLLAVIFSVLNSIPDECSIGGDLKKSKVLDVNVFCSCLLNGISGNSSNLL